MKTKTNLFLLTTCEYISRFALKYVLKTFCIEFPILILELTDQTRLFNRDTSFCVFLSPAIIIMLLIIIRCRCVYRSHISPWAYTWAFSALLDGNIVHFNISQNTKGTSTIGPFVRNI